MRVIDHDVEVLLTPEARARLPLARQVLLYLDPFSLFKDASRGSALARRQALSYNRRLRWMLARYARRWACIAALLFGAIVPAEAAAAQAGLFIYPAAAFAVGFCAAVAVLASIGAAYLLLGSPQGEE